MDNLGVGKDQGSTRLIPDANLNAIYLQNHFVQLKGLKSRQYLNGSYGTVQSVFLASRTLLYHPKRASVPYPVSKPRGGTETLVLP